MSPSRLVYAKLVAVSVIWGGTFVAGRFLAGELPALLLASLRFLLASLTLGLYLLITRTPLVLPDKRQVLWLALLGFSGIFAYNIFFFYGLKFSTASRASLVVALNPAMIALASAVFLKESLRPLQRLGIALCVLGAGLVIVSRNELGALLTGGLSGDLLILGCVFSWVVYSVCSRGLSSALGALQTVCYSIWMGTAMLCLATGSLLSADSYAAAAALSLPHWLALGYLGAVGSAIAYVWYYDAIRRIGPTRSGAFIALNPVSAVALGMVLFGETIGPVAGLGGLLAITGIFLCNNRQ